ncbi:SGNH family lipase [Streptomyces albidochromogenes]|uniref:SGNH/GDSL hydrolase family protein n=1 Tax=Streptomyces albidochromogenes TaxID=329524 RepID=UPI00110F9193|nr:SGNH/GDSL hydrolase family protein [Streptomyces albidochromogenes]
MFTSSLKRVLAPLLLIAATIGLAQPAYAAAAEQRYVALGDSYSSGVGAGSYLADSGSCQRSSKAYPSLWAAANAPASFSFTACSGATTSTVKSSQLTPLNSATTLISITAGGNDVGFASVMQTCVLQSEATCVNAVNNAITQINNTLPGGLSSLYGTIRSKAPQARVVVLGYPRFYQLNGSCIAGLSENERAAINRGSDALNGMLVKQAADAGFAYSSVVDEFTGHEICSGDAWLHSVSVPVSNSYHPTATGHSGGYLPAFRSTV